MRSIFTSFSSFSSGSNKKRFFFLSAYGLHPVKIKKEFLPAFGLLHPIKIKKEAFYQLFVFIGLK
jgi:hypothetical protein